MRIRIVLAVFALVPATAGAQPKGNPAMPCYQALESDARFSSIRQKVALGGAIDEMRKFTGSGERPTAAESAALSEWGTARESCQRLEADYIATRDTQIQALVRKYYAAVHSLIGELASGKLTYGDFGRRRLDLYESTNARIEERRREILPAKPTPLQPPGTK